MDNVEYSWRDVIRDTVHNLKWQHKIVVYEDEIKIDDDLNRLVFITKEAVPQEDKVVLEFCISDEYETDLIRCECTFTQHYTIDEIDLSFFDASLDEAMIKFLTRQYRSNLMMKRNRSNLGRLKVVVEEQDERKGH